MFHIEKDGFKFNEHRPSQIYIESNRLEDCIKYAIANDIRSFSLDKFHGYNENNIDFVLNEELTIEELLLCDDSITDISSIESLGNLKSLTFSVKKNKFKRINLALSSRTLVELRTNAFEFIDGIENLDGFKCVVTYLLNSLEVSSVFSYALLFQIFFALFH